MAYTDLGKTPRGLPPLDPAWRDSGPSKPPPSSRFAPAAFFFSGVDGWHNLAVGPRRHTENPKPDAQRRWGAGVTPANKKRRGVGAPPEPPRTPPGHVLALVVGRECAPRPPQNWG